MVTRMVYRQIGGDTVEPGSELGLCRIALPRAVDPQKDLLRQFFRKRLVVAHAVHERNHWPVVLDRQILKCCNVIAAGAKHHFSIRQRLINNLACCHLGNSLYLAGSRGHEQPRF